MFDYTVDLATILRDDIIDIGPVVKDKHRSVRKYRMPAVEKYAQTHITVPDTTICNVVVPLADPGSLNETISTIYSIVGIHSTIRNINDALKYYVDLLINKYKPNFDNIEAVQNISVILSILMYEDTTDMLNSYIDILKEQVQYQNNYVIEQGVERPTIDVDYTVGMATYSIDDWNNAINKCTNLNLIREMLESGDINEDMIEEAIEYAAEIDNDDLLALLCEYQI
jgi:hypothetical protein